MKDEGKTKKQLIEELAKFHQRIAELKRLQKDQKKTEEALRESEEMYRALVKTSPEAVAVHDLKGKIIDISNQWLKIYGYERHEEILGRSGFEFIAPESQERANASFKQVLIAGFVKNAEIKAIKKDNTYFIAELNGSLINDNYGKAKALMVTSRDITKKKNMEEKLRQYHEKLEQLVKERTSELRKAKKEVKSLRMEIQQSKKYPEIIGNSPKILQLIDLVHQVARTNSTVLIYGETGSGKDLIAKAIHYNSSRKESPFIDVNCAALPEHLIESELFGYVKGAFTGAVENKKGLFEEADKGTIFLNEIGEMPLNVQAKLLHIIENQQMRPLGQSKSITVDVRIIAASNAELEEAVNRRQFRKDLFYRLNVFPIKVPSLRERREDIPLLVKHFLDKFCQSLNKQITKISPETMEILCQYSYPGNVRELENIIQRSLIIAHGTIILPNHLPRKLRGIRSVPAPESLAEIEKQTIEAALRECKWNLSAAARKLQVHRTTLWRKIKRFGINTKDFIT